MVSILFIVISLVVIVSIDASAVLRHNNKCNVDAKPFSISGIRIDFGKIRNPPLDMCGENNWVQHRLIKLLHDYNIIFQLEAEEKVSFGTQLDEIMKGTREEMEKKRKKKKRSVVCGKYYWSFFISCITAECLAEVFSQLDNLWCNACGYIIIHPDDEYNFDLFGSYKFYQSEFIIDPFCTLKILWVRGER